MTQKLYRGFAVLLVLVLATFCVPPVAFAEKPEAEQAFQGLLDDTLKVISIPSDADDSYFVDIEAKLNIDGKDMQIVFQSAAAPGCGLFKFDISGFGAVKYAYGNDEPWLAGKDGTLYVGNADFNLQAFLDKNPQWNKARQDVANTLASLPIMLKVAAENMKPKWDGDRLIIEGDSYATFTQDNLPETIVLDVPGKVKGNVSFRNWQIGEKVSTKLFAPPAKKATAKVENDDIYKGIIGLGSFGIEKVQATVMPKKQKTDPATLEVVARDKDGHGILCKHQGKQIMVVGGTPEQMGTAQGNLLKDDIFSLVSKIIYTSGTNASLSKGYWFMDQMAEIERRTTKFIPERYFRECDALAAAAGLSKRDGRYANLFPELFHCSGVAVRGSATKDGRVIHARVLDYMRDLLIQNEAVVQVFIPEGHYAWISQSYAGFIGTVTAMNEHGLAIGEMGGGGEGNWDGFPMSLLIREVMETCQTVDEAVKLMKETPRTCEYYYVISDAQKNMVGIRAVPEEVLVLHPGEQTEILPFVPEDTVLISAGSRAEALSQKLKENHGKIDVPLLIEIIKRPVAMNANLHNAVFSPETLDIWVADAGDATVACDENYAKFNLKELIELYKKELKK